LPNAYKYAGNTTVVHGYITKYGKIVLHIDRTTAKHQAYGGTEYDITPIFN
jgi:hypothetical protein